MNELQIQRTPELIGSEIRDLTNQAKRMTLFFGIEIGRRLIEAKEMVGHGEWLSYLKEQTEFSQSSASRFMTLFKEYGSAQGNLFGAESNYPTLNNLSVSNALKLLALPSEEREEFAEEHDVEHLSTRELEKLLKEKEDAEEGAALKIADLEEKISAAEKERADAAEALKKTRDELKELRERPIETVLQVDEKAVEKAKADTAAEYTDKINAAQKKLEASEAKVDKLKDKLKKAEDDATAKLKKAEDDAAAKIAQAQGEKAKAEAELEGIKKQIQLSNPDSAVFKTLFETVQTDFNKLAGSLMKIRATDPDTAAKFTTAVKAVLDHMNTQISEA